MPRARDELCERFLRLLLSRKSTPPPPRKGKEIQGRPAASCAHKRGRGKGAADTVSAAPPSPLATASKTVHHWRIHEKDRDIFFTAYGSQISNPDSIGAKWNACWRHCIGQIAARAASQSRCTSVALRLFHCPSLHVRMLSRVVRRRRCDVFACDSPSAVRHAAEGVTPPKPSAAD
jgi:hypothetical protein